MELKKIFFISHCMADAAIELLSQGRVIANAQRKGGKYKNILIALGIVGIIIVIIGIILGVNSRKKKGD